MKILGCVFLILGSFLGAGFVSGREIADYFARFGVFCYPAIILAGILLFLLIYLFMTLSDKVNTFLDFSRMYFGKCSYLLNISFGFSLLIITSAMFAGLDEVARVLSINKYLVIMFTAILCFFCVLGNSRRLKNINLIFVPIMIVTICVLCLCNSTRLQVSDYSIISSLFSASSYVFINIVTLGVFILEVCKNYTRCQKICISFLTSLIVTICLIIIVGAIGDSYILCSTMPILALANNISIFSRILACCIWVGIFTTLMSNVYILSGYLQTLISSRKLCVFLVIVSSILFSFVGFAVIVKYVYLGIGLVGVIITIVVCKKEIENSPCVTILNN